MAYQYSVLSLVTAHTALRDLIDVHATLPGYLEIYDDSVTPVLLATITFSKPCGSIDAGTGRLTFGTTIREEMAPASGVALFGVIKNGNDAEILTMPVQTASNPVSGYLVLNSTVILLDAPVELVSATIG